MLLVGRRRNSGWSYSAMTFFSSSIVWGGLKLFLEQGKRSRKSELWKLMKQDICGPVGSHEVLGLKLGCIYVCSPEKKFIQLNYSSPKFLTWLADCTWRMSWFGFVWSKMKDEEVLSPVFIWNMNSTIKHFFFFFPCGLSCWRRNSRREGEK